MSLVKRLVGSRPLQRAVGVMAAEYLRLVCGIVGRGPFRVAADVDGDALETARRTIETELAVASTRAHELAGRTHGGAARV
jgi:hypothetical protein